MALTGKETFTEILEAVSKRPEREEDLVELVSPWAGFPAGDKYEDTTNTVEPIKAPKFEYKAYLRKFFIGADDDAITDYENIINRALSGEVVVRFEERTITKEGDVIILMSWLEPIKKPAPKENEEKATNPGTPDAPSLSSFSK